jgi:hypothetical protein
MKFRRTFLYPALAAITTISLAIIAYSLISNVVLEVPNADNPKLDFVNVTIILLTTVTVIFSVCALILGLLGVIGFDKLRKEAGRFASEKTVQEIEKSFEEEGAASLRIEREFQDETSYLRRLVERRVKAEVYELAPLFAALNRQQDSGDGLAEGEPTDEGQTD